DRCAGSPPGRHEGRRPRPRPHRLPALARPAHGERLVRGRPRPRGHRAGGVGVRRRPAGVAHRGADRAAPQRRARRRRHRREPPRAHARRALLVRPARRAVPRSRVATGAPAGRAGGGRRPGPADPRPRQPRRRTGGVGRARCAPGRPRAGRSRHVRRSNRCPTTPNARIAALGSLTTLLLPSTRCSATKRSLAGTSRPAPAANAPRRTHSRPRLADDAPAPLDALRGDEQEPSGDEPAGARRDGPPTGAREPAAVEPPTPTELPATAAAPAREPVPETTTSGLTD